MLMSYCSAHSCGLYCTNLSFSLNDRGSIWCFDTSRKMPRNIGLTKVSARQRAIRSMRAWLAFMMAVTPVAVLFRLPLSWPWLYLVTPVRFSRMAPTYSSMGNTCAPTHGVTNGVTASTCCTRWMPPI